MRDFIVQYSFGSDVEDSAYHNCTGQFIPEPTTLGMCYTFNSHYLNFKRGTCKESEICRGKAWTQHSQISIKQSTVLHIMKMLELRYQLTNLGFK